MALFARRGSKRASSASPGGASGAAPGSLDPEVMFSVSTESDRRVCMRGGCGAWPRPRREGRPNQQMFVAETDAFVSASKLPDGALQHTYLNLYSKSKRRGANPGRNILLQRRGDAEGRVRAATQGRAARRSIRILRRSATASSTAAGAAGSQLEAIAACESGGDPTAIGGGGLYRGKYQFSYGTWAVGRRQRRPRRRARGRAGPRAPQRCSPVTEPASGRSAAMA